MDDIITVFWEILGKLVLVIYLMWALWLTAMYTRYYTKRLTNSIYPNISINVFVILALFLLPKVRIDNLLPVYFNDTVPVIKGSIATTGILSYLFLMFFLSDKIVNLKSLRTFGYITAYANILSIMVVNLCNRSIKQFSCQEGSMPV